MSLYRNKLTKDGTIQREFYITEAQNNKITLLSVYWASVHNVEVGQSEVIRCILDFALPQFLETMQSDAEERALEKEKNSS